MPFPSGTYILQIGDGATRAELEQFYSLLAGYLSKEHKDDGSHSAVTADAVDVSGNLSVDGTITADADGSPVIIGETVSGPGIDINRTVSGVLTNWRIFADVSSGSPMLAIKDVGQVADASLLDIIRTVAGAAPEYTFRPHSSAHQLKLGANSSGQRWAEVNVNVVNSPNGLNVASTQTVANGATYDFPNGSSPNGLLFINAREDNASAIYHLRGGTGATSEVSDPVGLFSAASGTGGSTNIFWNGGTGTYRIENNRGAGRTYELVMLGTGII